MTFLTQSSLMTPTQRLQRAYVELMGHKDTMVYSGVLMVGKYVVDAKVRTACTDGIDCKYGEEFIKKQSDPTLRGLILHENLHKTYQHMFLWQHLYEEDARTANQACDYVINLEIVDLDKATSGFVKLPDGGLLDERFRGMSTLEVYNILRQEKDDASENGGQGSGQAGDKQAQGGGQPGDPGDPLDDHEWGRADEMSQEEVEQAKKDIDQAIRQGQIAAGKLGGNQSRALDALTEPQVDWREQLRDYVSSVTSGKDISTWQRVNRRWLQHNMYMPSTLSETIGRIVIAVDTSGSIGGKQLTDFLTEVQGIANNVKPEKIDLIYWDTAVARHEVYAQDNLEKLSQSTKPAGGGGTDVNCVPAYMALNHIRPECVIVLTDGDLYAGWGTWSVPVLWCISRNPRAVPTCGSAIHID